VHVTVVRQRRPRHLGHPRAAPERRRAGSAVSNARRV